MTAYACSDVSAFVPAGGICAGHSVNDKPADPDFPGFSVDCPVCEPILTSHPLWALDPEEVPLTAAEERKLERERRQLEVDALAQARADQEFLRRQRLEATKAEPSAKSASRARKASGASA